MAAYFMAFTWPIDQKTILMLVAAVLVVPTVISYITKSNVMLQKIWNTAKKHLLFGNSTNESPVLPTTPATPNPADWINSLYALQQVVAANGEKDAAELIGQAIIKIVGASPMRNRK
jgi:hypothetical protein